MEELYELIGIDMSIPIDKFIKQALDAPGEIIKACVSSVKSTLEPDPTTSHYAIRNLAIKLKCQIFTENVDNLHEKQA